MKRIGVILVTLACISLPASHLFSQKVRTVDDVPNVRLSGSGNAVSNPDSILSPYVVEELNHKLAVLQRQTSIEAAIVAVKSIGQMSAEDFGIRLFRQWGIGKKDKDNGLLILLVTDDRLVRFEVGYGLEGVLTDAASKRIQTQRMMPYLKAGDWNGAMVVAVDAVIELVTAPGNGLDNVAEEHEHIPVNRIVPLIFVLCMITLIIIASTIIRRRMTRCPRCHAQMKPVSCDINKVNLNTSVTCTKLKCPRCGYTTTRNTTNYHGSAIGGAMGGMLGRGGFGRGGGFSGGGRWGGGSAGGGGASTRF